jgi:uncharacterized protein YtpQ (UPF0354 family)
MPMSVDTERLADDLPQLMAQSVPQFEAGDLRQDPTLRHFGLKADIAKDGEGGHYWFMADGDVVLFASSQVPAAERDSWNPPFEQLMASLQITRDEELFRRKLINEVLVFLREKHPEQDFQEDEQGIRGQDHVVFLGNLLREVRADPDRREEIIRHFVDSVAQVGGMEMGYEPWDEAREQLVPVLKPRGYVEQGGSTRHLLVTDWLPEVVICYALRSKDLFRFVTGWDADRWGVSAEALHDMAIGNLGRLAWPKKLEGSRQPDGGRVILVMTGDNLASSRLLHPDLHRLFSGPLGSPFLAGVPDRDTLVLYSGGRRVKQRIARQLRKDHRKAAYPIVARPFLVTPDGIAPAPGSGKE